MTRRSRSRLRRLFGHTTWVLAAALVACIALGGSAVGAEKWIGIHGGPSIPSLQGGNGNPVSEGYTSRYGPFFGVFGDYFLNRNFAIRLEVNYSSEGGQRNGMQPAPDPRLSQQFGTLVFADFKTEQVLDYIEVPVMAKYSMDGTMRLYAAAGPYVGYLFHAETITTGSSAPFDAAGNQLAPTTIDFAGDTEIEDSINKWNYGLGGGIGVDMPFGPGRLSFDTHFSYGLANIQKHTETDGENNTGALVFALGYSVPFK